MRLPDRLGFRGKTLWDWLQLLIVPAILIAVTFAWSATQTRSDNKREDRRIAAGRAAAREARQDATLQGYLNQMSRLMLDKKLLSSEDRSAVQAVARTVTLTALHRLDAARKATVVRFLDEAQLITNNDYVDLTAADLRGAHLRGANLVGDDLVGADLRGADLTDTRLWNADLRGADLNDANLTDAALNGANLADAVLRGAVLRGADLRKAYFGSADLRGADLRDTILERAEFFDAKLRGANVTGADLTGASDVKHKGTVGLPRKAGDRDPRARRSSVRG